MSKTEKKPGFLRAVISGSFGNALAWFDYMMYGYFASIIATLYFPAKSQIASLMASFVVFGVGFFMRPLGGVIFGRLADKVGRVKSLSASIYLMGICTVAIGIIPTYASIGILAPILICLMRLGQGLSIGGGLGTAMTFVSEFGTCDNRGYVTSWTNFGTVLGMCMSSFAGLIISHVFQGDTLYTYGWRVAFWIGAVVLPYAYYIQHKQKDADVYQKSVDEKEAVQSPAKEVLQKYRKELLIMAGLLVGSGVTWYTVLTYMPTYMSTFRGAALSSSFSVSTILTLLLLVLNPLGGLLADKIGRKNTCLVACIGFALSVYPVFGIVNSTDSIVVMILALSIMVFFQALLSPGIMIVCAELVPTKVRGTAIGIGYNIALAVFGGMTPYVATAIIDATNDPTSIVWFLIGSVAVSLIACICMKEPSRDME